MKLDGTGDLDWPRSQNVERRYKSRAKHGLFLVCFVSNRTNEISQEEPTVTSACFRLKGGEA